MERHRSAIRAQVDAGMIEAALLALQTAGPPLHGRRGEWEYYMGYCLHILRKDRQAALRHYGEALALGYDEFWVRFHRGQLLLDLRRRREASSDLHRALELRPGHKGLSMLCYSVGVPKRD